jgi:hypothetical protein
VVRARGVVISTSAGVVVDLVLTWSSAGMVGLVGWRVLMGTVRPVVARVMGESVMMDAGRSGVTRTRDLTVVRAGVVVAGAAVVVSFGRFDVSTLSSQIGSSQPKRQICVFRVKDNNGK